MDQDSRTSQTKGKSFLGMSETTKPEYKTCEKK